jgi:hypothetical protein
MDSNSKKAKQERMLNIMDQKMDRLYNSVKRESIKKKKTIIDTDKVIKIRQINNQ